ncbi:MAG: GNAT family N-acetyltransferase [bacterium]
MKKIITIMVEAVSAQKEHIPSLQRAFQRARETRSLFYTDYLAQPAIADFHLDRVLKQIEHSEEPPFTLFFQDRELLAIASTAESPWHSEHFAVPYYKFHPFYTFPVSQESSAELVQTLKQHLLNLSPAVYTLRVEGFDTPLAYSLSQQGFVYVGTSQRLILHPNGSYPIDRNHSNQYDSLLIRDVREEDLPIMQDISRTNHSHNHFLYESRFQKDAIQNLFSEWVKKCVEGIAKKVFVAEYEKQVVGFSTLLLSEVLVPYINQRVGIIDFIIVDQQVQGQGISSRLLRESLDWLFRHADLVELRTMAENLRAIRFYEKNGFRMLSTDHHFHYWT